MRNTSNRVAWLIAGCLIAFSGCSGSTRPAKPPESADTPRSAAEPIPSPENAPALQRVSPELPPIADRPARDEQSIFFSPGSSTLSSVERAKLKRLAQPLLDDRTLTVTLVGRSADNVNRTLNHAIADTRMNAISTGLRKLGVASAQIRRAAPTDDPTYKNCTTSACRIKMRRVDLFFGLTATSR